LDTDEGSPQAGQILKIAVTMVLETAIEPGGIGKDRLDCIFINPFQGFCGGESDYPPGCQYQKEQKNRQEEDLFPAYHRSGIN
jgi:hypothetical protein